MEDPASGAYDLDFEFAAELWAWDANKGDSWNFVTLPEEVSAAVEDFARARGPRAGFGSVRVEVRVGGTVWRTSLFPDSKSGAYVLPIKKSVRRANELEAGDSATIHLSVL